MRCHHCSRPAAVTATSDGVSVGLCEDHVRRRLATLAESDALASLVDGVETE